MRWPVIPCDRSQAVTTAGPPASSVSTSVALLSLWVSISSIRL